jgi:hypothetical protein
VEVHCTVQIPNGLGPDKDVTTSATWVIAERYGSDGLTALTDIAVVTAPGRIVPVRSGNIAILVRIPGALSRAPHTYAVDPQAPAIALAPSLSVAVTDGSTGGRIEDAHVEIIDGGVDTGKSASTTDVGIAFLQHLRMGVPFTYRTTKAGYISATSTTPAIADDPATGIPKPSSLAVVLQRP